LKAGSRRSEMPTIEEYAKEPFETRLAEGNQFGKIVLTP